MSIEIKSTKDYSLFKDIKGNRGKNESHIKKLKIAIDANPKITEYNPILVNEKMEIIDGQHRKKAIEQLNLPVHYIQVEGLKLDDVQKLNSNKKSWTPMDYAIAFSITGNKNYDFYIEIKKSFKLNHDVTIQYAGLPNQNTASSFAHGHFTAGEDKDLIRQYCQQLTDIREFLPHAFLRSTALSLLSMFQNPNYDHAHMVKRMEQQGMNVKRFTRVEESTRELAEYYNKHKKSGKGYVLFNF